MTTVLLTGAGGAAIPGLIQHLKNQGYRVLAADMNPHAAGFFFADQGFVIPPGNSPEFLTAMRRICLLEKVDVLVPLVDEELLPALKLEESGVIVMLPRREFVETCLDKFRLMKRLQAQRISIPKTRLASSGLGNLIFPLVVKPRIGRGSRGMSIVYSEKELKSFLKNSPYRKQELLLQRFVAGTEFTVSVVVWRDGNVRAVVPKEVIFKKGITHLAVTRHDPQIVQLCKHVQETLKADGPFNVQLRMDAETGEAIPFEINPRFSSTVSLTIASGIDEVGGLIAQAVGFESKERFAEWREGLVLLRRTTDEFVPESGFQNRCVRSYTELKGDGWR